MRNDDPKFLEIQKAMIERAKYLDALTDSMIKGHQIIEMAMESTLPAFARKRLWGLLPHKEAQGFKAKAQQCEKVIKGREAGQNWNVLWAADSLRNELAHKRDTKKIDAKMKKLRTVYLSTLSADRAKGLKGVADDTVAHQACVSVAGFLYSKGDAKRREKR